jgi:hypothetical protein
MEKWRDIEGYEGLYQVSNFGRVRSLDRVVFQKNRWGQLWKVTYKGTILKQYKQPYYLEVDLCKDGVKKHHLVHRIEYEAFNGKIPEGMQVNHINEIKTDNRLENLNLMTPSENINWGTRNERDADKKRKKEIAV